MAPKASTASVAKRKKVDEMEEPPPKRMTRARTGKAVEVDKGQAKTSKASEKSSETVEKKPTVRKTAAAAKSRTVPVKTTMRRTRANNESMPDPQIAAESEAEQEIQQESTVRSGRKNERVAGGPLEKSSVKASTSASRRKETAAAVETQTKSTNRGRPKKTQVAVNTQNTETSNLEVTVDPPKRNTRGRPAATSTRAGVSKPMTKPVTAKKVKFQDDADKENVPLATSAPKKSAIKATGLKAKPVRKVTVSRTTRGKRAAPESIQKASQDAQQTVPLSPKKVEQVAKGDAVSEDELSGESAKAVSPSKSPDRLYDGANHVIIRKSPSKDRTPPASPNTERPSGLLSSPARRLQISPSKGSMTMSPKKVNINFNVNKPVLEATLNRSPLKTSLFHESPKKMKLHDSAGPLLLSSARTPMKTSLLQSPARRPMRSPTKSTTPRVEVQSSITQQPCSMSSPKRPLFSASQELSPESRTADSPASVSVAQEVSKSESESACPATTVSAPSAQLQSSSSELEDCNTPTDALPTVCPSESKMRNVETIRSAVDTPQDVAMDVIAAPTLSIVDTAMRRVSMESISTDELNSPDKMYAPTPLRRDGISAHDFCTPSDSDRAATVNDSANGVSFTPLIGKFDSWTASTSRKQSPSKPTRKARGMFSVGGLESIPAFEQDELDLQAQSPQKTTFFEDQMAVMDEQEPRGELAGDRSDGTIDPLITASQDSQVSEEYGDENAAPTEAEMLRVEQDADKTLTCTPAKVFTPAKHFRQRPQEMHTVSKIPLRASADEIPIRGFRQRSRSLGGPLTDTFKLDEKSEEKTSQCSNDRMEPEQPTTPRLSATHILETPRSVMNLDHQTPGGSVRKGTMSDVLKGAVVYVDVHTTEGADASGIFVDLLHQMGAHCVKQWKWNPRASIRLSSDKSISPSIASAEGSPSAAKVGITHVVYKDGGKRTLEKVQQSGGMVQCVGVGWVLDCEREDTWLDEAAYAIDTTVLPRGGHRRRKSMEPRVLASHEGNLVPAEDEIVVAQGEVSPTKEFLTFDTPVSRRDTFVIEHKSPMMGRDSPSVPDNLPSTPVITFADCQDAGENSLDQASPTTPYYLSKNAELLQRTCPPKRVGEPGGLFPTQGEIESQPDEQVRRKLIEARRKSLQWISKTRSPLGRTVSYGK